MKSSIMRNKVLCIVLVTVVVFVIAFGTVTIASYALYKKENKAIIILPGLFASGLYDEETNKGVWDPFVGLDLRFENFIDEAGNLTLGNLVSLISNEIVIEQFDNLFANDNAGNEDSFLNKMAMGLDSTPIDKNVKPVPWDSDNRLKYGVLNAQRQIYESLNDKYGMYYDVQIFNYDFRLDNRSHAERLEEFINEKGYDDVILVSHSNGGQVASIYLARSEENRQKVSKYISYCAPYYGSFSAISILEDLDDMMDGITSSFKGNPLMNSIAANIDEVLDKQFKKLLNMWTVYQLLPSYELLMNDYNEEYGIYIDGQKLVFEDNDDVLDFYLSRPWAKNIEGDFFVALSQWAEYQESYKVTMPDGSKVISTSLVDTVYYSGMGVNGINRIYYTTNGDTIEYSHDGYTTQGDGTVDYYSAIAGQTDYEYIEHIEGYNHYSVNIAFEDSAQDTTYSAIDDTIKSTLKWYYKLWSKIIKK